MEERLHSYIAMTHLCVSQMESGGSVLLVGGRQTSLESHLKVFVTSAVIDRSIWPVSRALALYRHTHIRHLNSTCNVRVRTMFFVRFSTAILFSASTSIVANNYVHVVAVAMYGKRRDKIFLCVHVQFPFLRVQ